MVTFCMGASPAAGWRLTRRLQRHGLSAIAVLGVDLLQPENCRLEEVVLSGGGQQRIEMAISGGPTDHGHARDLGCRLVGAGAHRHGIVGSAQCGLEGIQRNVDLGGVQET